MGEYAKQIFYKPERLMRVCSFNDLGMGRFLFFVSDNRVKILTNCGHFIDTERTGIPPPSFGQNIITTNFCYERKVRGTSHSVLNCEMERWGDEGFRNAFGNVYRATGTKCAKSKLCDTVK